MQKIYKNTKKAVGWTGDSLLFTYIFIVLIFKNEIALKLGSSKSYIFIFLGGLMIWLVNKLIIFMYSKLTSKKSES